MTPQKPKVLIVDDDAAVRTLLRTILEEHEFIVFEAKDLASAIGCLKCHEISLVTLDLMLGQEDGLSISREIRRISEVPIIIISAKSSDLDRIVGLEIGADDYIGKPFNVREVLARVRAVLRRANAEAAPPASPSIVHFGDFALSLERRELRNERTGQIINLTGAEFNILAVLAARPGRVQSRDAIIEALQRGSSESFDRSIDTLVSRLRKKIEPDPDLPRFIKTIRGAGYVFTGDGA